MSCFGFLGRVIVDVECLVEEKCKVMSEAGAAGRLRRFGELRYSLSNACESAIRR